MVDFPICLQPERRMPATVLNVYKSTYKLLTAAVIALVITVTGNAANATNGLGKGLIQLPTGELTKLTYVGEEYHYDNNNNGIPDEGDVMEGIAIITGIEGVDSQQSYSHQLKTREITAVFRFTITDGSMYPEGHIDFSLVEGDFFRLYVGVGNRKNYDPLAANAWDRAADGHAWISMEPDTFFESVNDVQLDGSTLNRTWADLATNNTRYVFLQNLIPTQLGLDPSHVFDDQPRGDIPAQLYFENFINGPSANPDYTFSIRGHFYVEAATEDRNNQQFEALIKVAQLLTKLLLSLF
jgi:hypothetical protein